MRHLLGLLFALTTASCASSGTPCCSVPLSFNIPCGICGGGSAAPQAAAPSTPLIVSRGEAPPPSAPASSTTDDEAVRRRAAFELQCDAKALEIVVLDSKTRGVTGCGKRATYVKECTSSGPCDWVPKPE